MKQPALFDCEDEPTGKPRLMAEPWLIQALVRLDVPREKAERFTLKQAFAVKAKLEKQKADADGSKPAKSTARPLPAPLAEPGFLPARASSLTRVVGAQELETIVAEYGENKANEDELYRFICGSLYLFTAGELIRVAKGLILVLRATDDREPTRAEPGDRTAEFDGDPGGADDHVELPDGEHAEA